MRTFHWTYWETINTPAWIVDYAMDQIQAEQDALEKDRDRIGRH